LRLVERRQRVKADRPAARIECGERTRGGEDRLRPALERGGGVVAEARVDDQERRLRAG
jgi:hypothetical protein